MFGIKWKSIVKVHDFNDFSTPEVNKIKVALALLIEEYAEETAKEIIEKIRNRSFDIDDTITTGYSLTFKYSSLFKMAGRRKHEIKD